MAVVNRLASQHRPAPVIFTVMATFALSTVLIGLSDALPLTVVLVGIAGATTLITEVIAVTLLQRAAPHDVVARVFGVYDQLNIGAIAVGSMLAGPLTDRLGATTGLVVVAIGCLAASTVVTWRMRGRDVRSARHRVVGESWASVATPVASGPRHARRDLAGPRLAARCADKRARRPAEDVVASTVS
jgi:predicted MFS family arabinose efflux permease